MWPGLWSIQALAYRVKATILIWGHPMYHLFSFYLTRIPVPPMGLHTMATLGVHPMSVKWYTSVRQYISSHDYTGIKGLRVNKGHATYKETSTGIQTLDLKGWSCVLCSWAMAVLLYCYDLIVHYHLISCMESSGQYDTIFMNNYHLHWSSLMFLLLGV